MDEIWFAVDIEVNTEAMEAIEFGLNEIDAEGTEINNLGKIANPTTRVTGYFSSAPDEAEVREALSEALRIYGFAEDALHSIFVRKLVNVDWLYEWKKNWKPTETSQFIISPTWEKFDDSIDKTVIYIDPAMAFGTGTHETTQLCIKAIEENFAPGMTFFDVGTGTGILAIAACKIAARSSAQSENQIDGCDTHEDSIRIARENAALNDIEAINFYIGSINAETPVYDFVCANLTIDVILPLLDLLLEKSRKILVLSGILSEQRTEISEALERRGIKDFHIEQSGMWISVLLRKTEIQ